MAQRRSRVAECARLALASACGAVLVSLFSQSRSLAPVADGGRSVGAWQLQGVGADDALKPAPPPLLAAAIAEPSKEIAQPQGDQGQGDSQGEPANPARAAKPAPAAKTEPAAKTGPAAKTAPAAKTGPAAQAESGADAPASRLAYLWDCMTGTQDEACRPTSAARANMLPRDAWRAHVRELLAATRPWTALPPEPFASNVYNLSHYNGSWVEGDWIARFAAPAYAGDVASLELFYPLVPIFAQWTDALRGPRGGERTHGALLDTVFGPPASGGGGGALRPDVLYVTVMRYDRVREQQRRPCAAWRNVLVLSSAGWGHVALPHLKGHVLHAAARMWPRSLDPVHFHKRRFASSYIGDNTAGGRGKLWGLVATPPSTLPKEWVVHGPSRPWRWSLNPTLWALAPSGVERGSWRLGEILQYGRVPLVLHTDVPWLPYQHNHDFLEPASVPPRVAKGGPHSVMAFGAVLRDALVAPPQLNTTAAPDDAGPDHWSSLATPGAMWGPGGVGFALTPAELPSFWCIACEFLKPGSAARWRHVRTLDLRPYGKWGKGQVCPCDSQAKWQLAGDVMGKRGDWSVHPTSLAYEMERRLAVLAPRYFTPEAVMDQVERFVRSPSTAELRCVPRPRTAQPPAL